MIDTLVFDMGGVLIEFRAELFAERLGLDAVARTALERCLLRTADWVRLDRGTIREEDVLANACRKLPPSLHAAAEEILYRWDRPIVPVAGMEALLRALKARGYRLYLLSNASRRQHEYWPRVPGSDCFDGTLISADVQCVKPEREIYEKLFETFSLTPTHCLFVDDFPMNIEAAENAGMQGVVFHDAQQLSDELKARGIL